MSKEGLMTQRELYEQDIVRMQEAIKITNSRKLKKDYAKAISRKKKELLRYDRFQKSTK